MSNYNMNVSVIKKPTPRRVGLKILAKNTVTCLRDFPVVDDVGVEPTSLKLTEISSIRYKSNQLSPSCHKFNQ